MKQGGEYAKRLKRLCQQIIRKTGRIAATEPTDPIEQLIIGILAGCTTHAKAQAVFRRLRAQMVDLNELRVTPPVELAEAIGELPLAREKAHAVVDALNAVRRRQDSLDLSFLRQRGRREARDYLESLEGVDRSASASVMLYSLGGHAIPVDDLTVYVLQKDEAIEPCMPVADLQALLERTVSAADARSFVEGLGRYVAGRSAKVPIDKLKQLLKREPPPRPPAPPQITANSPPPVQKAPTGKAGSPVKAPAPSKAAPVAKPGAPAKPADPPKPQPPRAQAAAKPATVAKVVASGARSGKSGRSGAQGKTAAAVAPTSSKPTASRKKK